MTVCRHNQITIISNEQNSIDLFAIMFISSDSDPISTRYVEIFVVIFVCYKLLSNQ